MLLTRLERSRLGSCQETQEVLRRATTSPQFRPFPLSTLPASGANLSETDAGNSGACIWYMYLVLSTGTLSAADVRQMNTHDNGLTAPSLPVQVR